ncbi:hypothetical protein [Bacteroides sp. 224]|uniref:hypothetical protein n=1 Tax=Bacteroides sp. 224 TaxID=2302936 RepID=UPI0013D2882F|nr:hypothetical protein [Bacteroides sp. 224]
MRKVAFTIFLVFSFVSISVAQTGVNKAFSKVLEVTNEKNKKESFKGQILKGKRNGMGLLAMKDGYIFVGDFYRGEIAGYGMFIAPENEFIKNCNNSTVYIGNLRNGQKTGFGSCYTANGNLIYQGQFEEDKPIDVYPLVNADHSKSFSLLELANGDVFLGETKDGNANGYGILLFKNGDLWLSSFKNGFKKGIGLYLFYNGEWETLNFVENNYDVVSSSANYRNIDAARKQATRSSLMEAMGCFVDAASTAVSIAGNTRSTPQGGSLLSSMNNNSGITSSSTIQNSYSESSKDAKKTDLDRNAKWMRDNYQIQKKVYSDGETLLIKMKTYPETYNNSLRIDTQTRMKKVRETIISHGGTCVQSEWETWKP